MHNAQLSSETKAIFENKIVSQIGNSTAVIIYSALSGFVTEQQKVAIEEFDARKMGDDEISKSARDKFEQDLKDLQAALIKVSEAYDKSLNSYTSSMKGALNAKDSFFDQSELMKLHSDTKAELLKQVWSITFAHFEGKTNFFPKKFSEEAKVGGTQMAMTFQQNAEHQIEQKFTEVQTQNEQKRQQFIVSMRVYWLKMKILSFK